MGERADKRDAALVGADKTPTKLNEGTDEAGIASRVDERSSSERKKTRGTPLFSNTSGSIAILPARGACSRPILGVPWEVRVPYPTEILYL